MIEARVSRRCLLLLALVACTFLVSSVSAAQSSTAASAFEDPQFQQQWGEIINAIDLSSSLPLSDGRVYFGALDSAASAGPTPHGSGIVKDAQGSIVEGGSYVQGKLQGAGFQFYADGSHYTGEFLDGWRHSTGELVAPTYLYRGQWLSGVRHGLGVQLDFEPDPSISVVTGAAPMLVESRRFEGTFAHGVHEGVGMEWNVRTGAIMQAGRWHEGVFKDRCAIPRAALLEGWLLPPESRQSEFVLWDGSPCTYEGQRNEAGRPHGTGRILDRNGKAVQGDNWLDGKQHGEGYLHSHNSYVGSFLEGRFHGQGFYTLASGTTYDGEWSFDEMEGYAVLTRPPSASLSLAAASVTPVNTTNATTIFEGHWRANHPSGYGVRWSINGSREDGSGNGAVEMLEAGWYVEGHLEMLRPVPMRELRVGRFLCAAVKAADLLWPGMPLRYYKGSLDSEQEPHGTGTLFLFDGTPVAGPQWEHGIQAGTGFQVLSTGERYEGGLVDGRASGQGTQHDSKGELMYSGAWREGLPDGQGTLIENNGASTYTGSFLAGAKHGQGELHLADGSTYKGDWHHNMMHGRGRLEFADGAVFDGTFDDSHMTRGTLQFADGSSYKGEAESMLMERAAHLEAIKKEEEAAAAAAASMHDEL